MVAVATRALKGVHKIDPRETIFKKLPPAEEIDQVKLQGARVLCAVYERPEQTAGGIYLADNTRAEDKYQGKAMMVLAKGPLAFKDDDRNHFEPPIPEVGDWVAVRVGDTFALTLGEQLCRVVQDVDIQMIIPDPDIVI